MNRLSKLSALVLSTCAVLNGCGSVVSKESVLIRRLNNRGPVMLSSENPFLAGNLLLSKEMEKSEELTGFIQHRGAPAAIEVEKGYFSSLSLKLYYPENNEMFRADNVDGVWIIGGSQEIPANNFEQINSRTKITPFHTPGEAVDEAYAPEAATHGEISIPEPARERPIEVAKEPVSRPRPAATITPKPAATEARKEDAPRRDAPKQEAPKHESAKHDAPSHLEAAPTRAPVKQAIEGGKEKGPSLGELSHGAAQHPAELTPKGDLVHYVTYEGESLSLIAEWYTKDSANAEKIGRINRLTEPATLSVGDVIVVPGYLLKNKNRLPERAVKPAGLSAAH